MLATILLTVASPIQWAPLGEPGVGGAMTDISVSPHDSRRILVCGDMLGIGLSTDGGESWGPTFGLVNYQIGSVTWHPTDPSTVWVGTMSGPFLSKDAGKTWALKRTGFPPVSDGHFSAPIEEVVFTPGNPRRLLAFGGSSRRWDSPGAPKWGWVYASEDAGETWRQISTVKTTGGSGPSPDPGVNLISGAFFAGSTQRLIAAASGEGIFVSSDAGNSWRPSNDGLPHRQVERCIVHPTNPRVAWVSLSNFRAGSSGLFTPGGVYKTTDGGASWRPLNHGLDLHTSDDPNTTARFGHMAVSASDPDVMAVSDTAWNTGILYVTRNGGQRWEAKATRQNIGRDSRGLPESVFRPDVSMFAGLAAVRMAIDPRNPGTIFGINTEWILRSKDFGKTWTDQGSRRIDADHWRGRGYNGWCSRFVAFDPFTKGRLIVQAMDAGRAWLSTDAGQAWRYGEGFNMPWFSGNAASWTKGGRVYAAYGQFGAMQGIGRSDDGGQRWRVFGGAEHGLPPLTFGGANPVDAVHADPADPDRVLAAIGGEVYESTNGGEKWRKLPRVRGIYWLTGHPQRPGEVFAIGTDGVFRRSGKSGFVSIGGPKPAQRAEVLADGSLLVTSWRNDRGGVYRWRGGAWTRLLVDRFAYAVAADPKNPDRIAVTTAQDPYHDIDPSVGIYVSADGGKTWSLENQGLPMRRGQAIAFDPFDSERIVFGSYGRGFFLAKWPLSYRPTGDIRYESTVADAEACQPVPAGGNLVRNGSFAEGALAPDHWTVSYTGAGRLDVARDTATKFDGVASLRAESSDPATEAQVSQFIEGNPGEVGVKGQVRSEGLFVIFGVQAFTADWKPIELVPILQTSGRTEWQTGDKTVKLPTNTARFAVVLFAKGAGKAWLDAVTVEPIEGSNGN